jgi:quinol monooxygenase YgiN
MPDTLGPERLRRRATENMPSNDNLKEQLHMPDERTIMLIEAKVQPRLRQELIEALREYLPLVRGEPGVVTFNVYERKDDLNAFVFHEIYESQAAHDLHLEQDFTKKFLAILKRAQAAERVRTNLVEVPL